MNAKELAEKIISMINQTLIEEGIAFGVAIEKEIESILSEAFKEYRDGVIDDLALDDRPVSQAIRKAAYLDAAEIAQGHSCDDKCVWHCSLAIAEQLRQKAGEVT